METDEPFTVEVTEVQTPTQQAERGMHENTEPTKQGSGFRFC